MENPISALKGLVRVEGEIALVAIPVMTLAAYGGVTIASKIIKHHEIIFEIE